MGQLMTSSEFDALVARVETLESQVRWRNRLASIAGISCLLMGSGFVAQVYRPQAFASGSLASHEIVAERFVLVDEAGRELGALESSNLVQQRLKAESSEKPKPLRNWGVLSLFDDEGHPPSSPPNRGSPAYAVSVAPDHLWLQNGTAVVDLSIAGNFQNFEVKGAKSGFFGFQTDTHQGIKAQVFAQRDPLSLGVGAMSDRGTFFTVQGPENSENQVGLDATDGYSNVSLWDVASHPHSPMPLLLDPQAEFRLPRGHTATLLIRDKGGKVRTVIGHAEVQHRDTGKIENTAPSSMTFFDKTGALLLRIP